MPTPKVIDLSHHNSIPRDLIAAKQSGIIGCIHKCTEGKSYDDDKVASRYYLATQAGMVWGLYHFLRPGDMQQQAKFFIDRATALNVIDDNTLLAADHEDPGVSFAQLCEFLDAVEFHSNRIPVIYSGHVLKDQMAAGGLIYPNKYRLWLAQYGSKAVLPAGCDAYYMWQYSDKATVPGISPPTDVNAIELSDRDFLDAWSGMALDPDVPVPSPEEVATITLSSDKPVALRILAGTNVTLME